ncbi:hypothetical protein DFH27DRAFT_488138 [Peziza echinospora]|nr:hypothetical protein DFH27DRAFT_488138 [Peziza echinospora]
MSLEDIPRGKVLGAWDPVELEQVDNTVTKENFEFVTSYNWLPRPDDEPTIVAPGSPALWTPTKLPLLLQLDTGNYFIDQNGHRFPSAPLEPLIRALLTTHPNYDFNELDMIIDRNSLRKLLRFVRRASDPSSTSSSSDYGNSEYKMYIQRINNTLLFTRWAKKTIGFIKPNEFRGFGREFQNLFLKYPDGMTDSTDHQRLVKYSLGGLKLLVRFTSDGYIDMTKGFPQSSEKHESKLTVIPGGKLVPQESIIEVKTRGSYRPIDLSDQIPQLWFSNTTHLFVGYHQRGNFKTIEKQNMAGTDFESWEKTNQEDLKKLVGLLQKIVAITREAPEKNFQLAFVGGKLKLHAMGEGEGSFGVISEELISKFYLIVI